MGENRANYSPLDNSRNCRSSGNHVPPTSHPEYVLSRWCNNSVLLVNGRAYMREIATISKTETKTLK